MPEKYAGRADDKRYVGEQADITFSPKRCIHAAYCVSRLNEVFDTEKRPWIDADNADAVSIAETIRQCPSGALHYERKDGGVEEPTPDINRIILWQDGPLQFIGDIDMQGATVAIEDETRATLCRCGASKQKPFCDNSHIEAGFSAEETPTNKGADATDLPRGKVTVTAHENGPLEVNGQVRIETPDGRVIFQGDKTWLCRCGGSSSKPFCDGTHNKNGFEAE